VRVYSFLEPSLLLFVELLLLCELDVAAGIAGAADAAAAAVAATKVCRRQWAADWRRSSLLRQGHGRRALAIAN